MADFIVTSLDGDAGLPLPASSRRKLEARLLEHFTQYATEDVTYSPPGSPPIAMTFAALGHFFTDSMALGDMTASSQHKFVERIAPPLGRHITWSDFKLIIALVAEKRFPREQQDVAMRQTVEDIVLNLQLGAAASRQARGISQSASNNGGGGAEVAADDLYAHAESSAPAPTSDASHPLDTSGDDAWRGVSEEQLHSSYGGASAAAVTPGGKSGVRELPTTQSALPAATAATGKRMASDSRSASRMTSSDAATATSSKAGGKGTCQPTTGKAKSAKDAAALVAAMYLPRAIYTVADAVMQFATAGHSGAELCRRLRLPAQAAAPFDTLTSPQLSDWTPAQRVWLAIVQAAPVVFPGSNAIAAEELTFQKMLDGISLLA